jgi:hypothetical protein
LLQSLLLLATGITAHAKDNNIIYWSPAAKLQFADFMGSRTRGDNSYIGKTAATIVPKVKYGKDSFYYKVDCVFEKENSVIVGHRQSVLEHEQGHFDITEIIARQIRKNLAALATKSGIADSVNHIVDAAYKQGERLQQAYEADCGYGDTPVQQEAWNQRIKEMLDKLKSYDQAEGTVKLN